MFLQGPSIYRTVLQVPVPAKGGRVGQMSQQTAVKISVQVQEPGKSKSANKQTQALPLSPK